MTASALSIVTLGVADVAKSRRFYEALGYVAASASNEMITFFQAGGVVLALFERGHLAQDATVADQATGFAAVTVARNVASPQDVDRALSLAVVVGAKLLKPGQKVFWGGYSGYFADPDGHLWEVAHNPFFPLSADGSVRLP